MNLKEYIAMQTKYITWWSHHFHTSLDRAVFQWVEQGLAEKFADKYRLNFWK